MKKVVYSVTRSGKFESKLTGIGFITESDLVIACMSKNGKPYIRIFEDCIKNCHPIIGRENEYHGAHYEIREIEVQTTNSSGDDTGSEKREIELNYRIWYKITD